MQLHYYSKYFLKLIYLLYLLYCSDGDKSFSEKEETINSVKTAINEEKKDELKTLFNKGWRTHHSFKEGDQKKFYLSLALEKNTDLLKDVFFTISEEALLDNKNYEKIFSNEGLLEQLTKNYGSEFGFDIKNEEVKKSFIEAEKNSSNKDLYKKISAAFGIVLSNSDKKADKAEVKEDKKEEAVEKKEETEKKEDEPEKKEDEPEKKEDAPEDS